MRGEVALIHSFGDSQSGQNRVRYRAQDLREWNLDTKQTPITNMYMSMNCTAGVNKKVTKIRFGLLACGAGTVKARWKCGVFRAVIHSECGSVRCECCSVQFGSVPCGKLRLKHS